MEKSEPGEAKDKRSGAGNGRASAGESEEEEASSGEGVRGSGKKTGEATGKSTAEKRSDAGVNCGGANTCRTTCAALQGRRSSKRQAAAHSSCASETTPLTTSPETVTLRPSALWTNSSAAMSPCHLSRCGRSSSARRKKSAAACVTTMSRSRCQASSSCE